MNYGDIVQLGRHRLMCGDATCREDVMRFVGSERVDLVLTDPPYGIQSVDRKTRTIGGGGRVKFGGAEYNGQFVRVKQYATVIGDTNGDMFTEHYHILRRLCNYMIIWGGQNFTRVLPPSCGWIFWDKDKGTDKLSFSDGELAYTNCSTRIKKYVHKWNGFTRAGSQSLNEKVHPNQKPVELHMHILEDFTQPEDIILDCFGGSGTTLIACEMTGRKCLMMEISPEYCDIIRERYHQLAPLFTHTKEDEPCPEQPD